MSSKELQRLPQCVNTTLPMQLYNSCHGLLPQYHLLVYLSVGILIFELYVYGEDVDVINNCIGWSIPAVHPAKANGLADLPK